jgi:hypothetical protein
MTIPLWRAAARRRKGQMVAQTAAAMRMAAGMRMEATWSPQTAQRVKKT